VALNGHENTMRAGNRTPPENPEAEAPAAGRSGESVPAPAWVLRLRLLWEGRRALARIFAAGTALALALALLLPNEYQSTTRLMPPDSAEDSNLAMLSSLAARGDGLTAGVAGNLLGIKSSGALFIGILHSRTVEDRLVRRFGLRKVYGVAQTADARAKLDAHTAISEDRQSGILTLTVTDRSPQRAAVLAGAYIDELNRLVAELSTSSAHRERVFLAGRLKGARNDLDQAERNFSQFASRNTAIDIPAQGKAMVDAAARLQGERIAAQAELEGLRQIYTENNARVREARARVAELERQLEKLGGKDGTGAETSQASLYPSIRQLPLLGVPYADLYRRTQIEEAVYETLTQQYEMAKMEEAKETPSVKVLDAAAVPEEKSFPPRALIVLLGALLSFCLGAVWLSARRSWSETDPLDPRKALAVEVARSMHGELGWVLPNGSGQRGFAGLWGRYQARHDGSGLPE
jgi:uncharacterized protein involved in exopolysaccharide biosynthesis